MSMTQCETPRHTSFVSLDDPLRKSMRFPSKIKIDRDFPYCAGMDMIDPTSNSGFHVERGPFGKG